MFDTSIAVDKKIMCVDKLLLFNMLGWNLFFFYFDELSKVQHIILDMHISHTTVG